MNHRLSIALVGLLIGLCAFGSAHAATRVLGLHVDGEKLSPKDKGDLFAVLQAKLRLYPDVELKNPPAGELTDEMIDLECIDLDASCLSRLGKKYQADKVVHVEVRFADGKNVMHVRFVDVDLQKVTREREVKADKAIELASALELEVEAVFGQPPAPPSVAKGTLIVEVDSPNAVIQVGPDYLGTGTATAELAPGEYTVRISQTGFEDIIKKVAVKSGETTTESFKMVAIAPGPGPGKKEDDDDDEWVIWTVVGAVVVAGAITAIAIAAGSDEAAATRGPLLGIDRAGAWRDPATIEGRR